VGEEKRLVFWQAVTAGTLLVGYAGYYVCRSDLSVATPLLLGDGRLGVDKRAIGLVTSSGILAYALGKVSNGILGDFLGGRVLFLLGMVGSILATVWFGLAFGLTAFLLAWTLNRFVQSTGWVGLVKVASQWFAPETCGTVMGVLSLSFLFGDAAVRLVLGGLIARGLGWRGVFFAAASILALIAAVTTFLLRPDPKALGLPSPRANQDNVFGAGGEEASPAGIRDLLLPFLRRPAFWYVCFLSLGLTLIRETFNAWTPTYLVEAFGMTHGSAAQKSAVFPFVGGLSVIVVGVLSDRFGGKNRVRVALPFLLLSCFVLAYLPECKIEVWGLVLIGAAAFLVIGPYSLMAGAIAVDLGGKRGSATAAGLIDSAGYLGAILSGYTVGSVVEAHGWGNAFRLLAFISALTTIVAFFYCRQAPGTGGGELERAG
jgi:OPA family glycerol-3-phosphate transporter-like MFS transporter